MTDRIEGFAVILDHDMREDDVQSTLEALRHIKNVLSVRPMVSDMSATIAETRVLAKVRTRLFDALADL